jgi:hypothetical protein
MLKSTSTEIEFKLKKLILRYSGLFMYHQWPSEHARWVELLFALVSKITKKSETEVRAIIEQCDALSFLDVEELSAIPGKEKNFDLDFPLARRMFEFLAESGLSEEESKRSIVVMHEAAQMLKEKHDGRIQKYLRKYGQRMIDELPQNFSFSELNEEDTKYAFSYWLQNALNMPVILDTEYLEKFCKQQQITDEDLSSVADDLDINLALLDDMIELYMKDLGKIWESLSSI